MKFEKLVECFDFVQEIKVTLQGEEICLEKGNDKFEVLIKTLKEITNNSHEMPAFGVVLTNLQEKI